MQLKGTCTLDPPCVYPVFLSSTLISVGFPCLQGLIASHAPRILQVLRHKVECFSHLILATMRLTLKIDCKYTGKLQLLAGWKSWSLQVCMTSSRPTMLSRKTYWHTSLLRSLTDGEPARFMVLVAPLFTVVSLKPTQQCLQA